MACPLCGDPCTCSATGAEFAGEHTAVLIDPDSNYSSDLTEQQFASSLEAPAARATAGRPAVAQAATAVADPAFYRPWAEPGAGTGDAAWRDEISQRVLAHKARRRRRFDPDASLSLGFEESAPEGSAVSEPMPEPAPAAPRMYRRIAMEVAVEPAPVAETNVIEFPRPVTQEMFPPDELAEPILDSPRILEVPEEAAVPVPTAALLSPLASIRLDEGEDGDKEVPDWIRNYRDDYEQAEVELPLQVAPLRPRFLSAAVDTALVLTATALFCVIVLSITKFMPEGKAAVLAAVGLGATLWLAYHYLFLVFSGLTPGMQVAQLELCSFEGCYPQRQTRGARAWAMGVSCMSLGMGFAWAVVDEDSLGWHDRITRTYLRLS